MRDYSGMFRDGRCVICDQSRHEVSYEVHSEIHLARGEALVDTGRVVPMPAPAVVNATPRFTRRIDPKLRALVRAAQKRIAAAHRKASP